MLKKVNEMCGIKESDTGLVPPSRWDLVSDKQMMQEEQPLQVARCTKIINEGTPEAKYIIHIKHGSHQATRLRRVCLCVCVRSCMRVCVYVRLC